MRTINKFIYLFAAASLLGLASCQPEENFKPGKPDNEACEGVYFPKQDVTSETQIFDPTQVKQDTIIVRRGNTDGALVVKPAVSLSYTDSKGASVAADSVFFTVSDIEFIDGQEESFVAIDFSEAEEGVQYSLHLTIEGDEYASNYSSNLISCDYKVMCVAYIDFVSPADSTKPAKVTFTQGFWGEVHTGYIKYYEVGGIRHCITYGEELVGEGSEDGGFFGVGENYHLEFDWYVEDQACTCDEESHSPIVPAGKVIPENAELIHMKPAYVFTTGGQDLYEWDYFSFYQVYYSYARPFLHFIVMNDLYDSVSYYDGNGGFYFYSYPGIYNTTFNYGAKQDGIDIVGIAEGFTREDFSLELSSGITQQDSEGNNVVPVAFDLGADVAKVGYTILEGKVSSAAIANEVNAIAKDTIDYKYATYVDALGVSFVDSVAAPATGVYTLVAAAFDTLKQVKASASISFEYLLTGESNEVILNVETGSTSPYASQGYSPITSFAFTISGSGITGAIPMVYSQADIESFGGIDALVDDILANPNDYYPELEEYGLTAAQLANVNDKGYTDIVTGRKALTTYYFIVWATNGYDVTVKYSTITTDGLPNEVIKKETATYAYSVFWKGDDEGLNLEFNPNSNLYEIPNWGYGVSFAFDVQNDTISVPIQPTGYTHSQYGPVSVCDYQHVDELIEDGWAEYIGLDTSEKGYIDEDGYYHFFLAYGVKGKGTFGTGEEIFYPDGKPAAAPDPEPSGIARHNLAKTAVKLQKINFVTPAGANGIKPVSGIKRVEANHKTSLSPAKVAKSGVKEIQPAKMQGKKRFI